MSKILVTTIFTILILGIVIGGGMLLWQWLSRPADENTAPSTSLSDVSDNTAAQFLPTAEKSDRQPDQNTPADSNDDDNDGLSNSDEARWNTDPNNPDTDGDGYLDGEEVAANHNPAKPAPDDLLAVDTNSTKEPAVGTPAASAFAGLSLGSIERYFDDSLDLSQQTNNLTRQYEAQYTEDERSAAARQDFANQQPIITLLPRPEENVLPDVKEDSPNLMARYLDVANNPYALANSNGYAEAQYELQSGGDASTMLGLTNTIKSYRQTLIQTPVPASALPVHTLLLGYTELLASTFEQIAARGEDPVKSIAATRQLEVIDRQYYPVIHDELQRLEAMR